MNFLTNVTSLALPELMGSVIEKGFEDPRIAQIVAGAGFVVMGATLVVKSGIPARFCGKAQEMNLKEKTLRWSTAAVGMIAICYGVYSIAQTVFQFPEIPFPNAPVFSQPSNAAVDPTNTPIPKCNQPQLWPQYEAQITNTLNKCTATKKLGDQARTISAANGRAPWQIKIVPREFQNAEATAAFPVGQVRIKCDAEKPVSLAAFELINYSHQNEFTALWEGTLAGQIKSRDEYAQKIEFIEYQSTQQHVTAMEECIRELGWKQEAKIWSSVSWDWHWSYISTSPHAEWARQQWDSAPKPTGHNKPKRKR